MRKLCRFLPRPVFPAFLSLALLGPAPSSAQVVVVGGQPACIAPVPLNPPAPILTPWIYRPQDGSYVWGDHQFWEDPGNTVFSLARDLVAVPAENDPPGARPDVLLFNSAHFDPPEGEPVPAGGTRKLMGASLAFKGLQLLVNYSGARIDAAFPSVRYLAPTFFVSVDGHFQNSQTTPPVPWSGFSQEFISATRGAFGCAFTAVTPHTAGPSSCDDLYVTAGLGYGLSDLDPDPAHQAEAAQAQTDRLMTRDPSTGRWGDVAQNTGCPGGVRVPATALSGNSSGVVFADLTGDGWADLYVGKPGDRLLGAPNVLLVNDGTGCFTDQTAARIPSEPARATVDVAAADLEGDGDLDLVVANRCRQSGSCGTESEDYVLINNGGVFGAPVWLNAGQLTDTRSVAVGQLNSSLATPDSFPEIVLGNAGTDGFANDLVLAQDHRMQIFENLGANTFVDRMDPWLDTNAAGGYPTESQVTAPHTFQVLLTDLFHPKATNPPDHTPDGWLDLVIVNHRDILQHGAAFGTASRVNILANKANWGGPAPYLSAYTAFPSAWVRTVAAADFTGSGFSDLLQGKGSRFAGVLPEYHKNLGSATTSANPWDFSGGFINDKSYKSMPATEHGYGFDFADVDGDGFRDALQTSRGYDYFAFGIDSGSASHRNLTGAGTGTGKTDNRRGRQAPQGMEDGVFADFDRDGDLDALMASQRTPAWPICADVSPDSIVLANTGAGNFGHDAVSTGSCSKEDARIDLVNRVSHPGIADRAVAGDLDNDGDVDAIVHLFELLPPGWSSSAVPPVLAAHGFTNNIDTYSFGWRYLENVIGEPGAGSFWFRDVAPVKMKSPTGVYDPNWNRFLGMDLLADFDNNGALDLYTTVGFAKNRTVDFLHSYQMHDLLFLNGVGGQPKGTLVDSSLTYLPPPCTDAAQDTPNDPAYSVCGSFGLAQGDVDNDGDADLVVTHYAQTGRVNYPSLLINRLAEPGINAMVDEFSLPRIPFGNFSNLIHTPATDMNGAPTPDMDRAMFPVLFDMDGDGDLDMAYQVVDDLLRVFRNDGADSNNDGLITAADTPPPGTFTDVTAATLRSLKPTTDAQDVMAVDLDRDGDLDLAIDPFTDRVFFWRNDRPADEGRPAVTEAWPRVGSTRRRTVRLEGIHLDGVVKVQFRFAGGAVCEQTIVTPVAGSNGTLLDLVIPNNCPLGLAQVRVLRSAPACGGGGTIQTWSRQYFGYFIQG